MQQEPLGQRSSFWIAHTQGMRCVEEPPGQRSCFRRSCTPKVTTTVPVLHSQQDRHPKVTHRTVTVLHSQQDRHPKVTHRTVSALETPPRQRHCAEGGGAEGEHPATLGSGGLAGGRCAQIRAVADLVGHSSVTSSRTPPTTPHGRPSKALPVCSDRDWVAVAFPPAIRTPPGSTIRCRRSAHQTLTCWFAVKLTEVGPATT